MKILKSLFITLALIVGMGTAYAEEGKGTHGAGVTFGFGTGHGMNNFGLGVRYNYMLSDNVRIEPSFMYYFNTDSFTQDDISFNAHYLFNMADDKFHIYPIFGVTTIFGKEKFVDENDVKINDHYTRFGCNLGVGFQYDVTHDFSLIGEAKYKLVKDFGNVHFAVGCLVTF